MVTTATFLPPPLVRRRGGVAMPYPNEDLSTEGNQPAVELLPETERGVRAGRTGAVGPTGFRSFTRPAAERARRPIISKVDRRRSPGRIMTHQTSVSTVMRGGANGCMSSTCAHGP
jgi:hypothetical protein